MLNRTVAFLVRRLLALLMLLLAIILPRDLALQLHDLIRSW